MPAVIYMRLMRCLSRRSSLLNLVMHGRCLMIGWSSMHLMPGVRIGGRWLMLYMGFMVGVVVHLSRLCVITLDSTISLQNCDY